VGINEASIVMVSVAKDFIRKLINNDNFMIIFKRSLDLSLPDGSFVEFSNLAGASLRINH
jgi:hypothetical protein